MFIIDANDLKMIGSRHYTTSTNEGWGLTHDGNNLIVTDGSSTLFYFDFPANYSLNTEEYPYLKHHSLTKVKEVTVKSHQTNKPVVYINELEYADGHIYANIWYQDIILKINPSTGIIIHIYEMEHIYPRSKRSRDSDCLNGIAYNPQTSLFMVTGKKWPMGFLGRFPSMEDLNISRKEF
jgi:glutamine cyclotransferase